MHRNTGPYLAAHRLRNTALVYHICYVWSNGLSCLKPTIISCCYCKLVETFHNVCECKTDVYFERWFIRALVQWYSCYYRLHLIASLFAIAYRLRHTFINTVMKLSPKRSMVLTTIRIKEHLLHRVASIHCYYYFMTLRQWE